LIRRIPSSLLRRSSVQAALRPFGSLEDLLWVTSFNGAQNAQKHEKCGLLA
jgi:hypothetical protein